MDHERFRRNRQARSAVRDLQFFMWNFLEVVFNGKSGKIFKRSRDLLFGNG